MQRVSAPAKLTLSLRVTGVRPDGYHLLESEMVNVDLVDTLEFSPGQGVEVVDKVVGGLGTGGLAGGPGNLVDRALAAVGRRAAVRVVKRIPLGAGLGGGSADAAAVLRWAGCADLQVAASLGSDVPFCLVGGRALVRGAGELVDVLPVERRAFLLVLPPLAVDTAAVYRAWDAGHRWDPDGAGASGDNDLEPAALAVAPALARWRDALGERSGRQPRLAGSGAAWFVDADEVALGHSGAPLLVDGRSAPLVAVRTVDAPGPDAPLPPGGAGVFDRS